MIYKRFFAILAASLTLTGAGCGLSQKVGWHLPFSFDSERSASDARTATDAIALKPGLSFVVRPSALGMSGSVEDLLGANDRSMKVTINRVDTGRSLALTWSADSATGTISLVNRGDAKAMLLPAFWTTGDVQASGNGGLWLSPSSYSELASLGKTEWRLGVAENVISPLSAALRKFNDLSARIFGSTTDTRISSPFTVTKTAVLEAYPLKVDGQIVRVRAVKAASWFAEFLILENPDNPLILKTTVNPLAAPALKAFETTKIRWNESSYELTSISNP
jgi:hypothetical protein